MARSTAQVEQLKKESVESVERSTKEEIALAAKQLVCDMHIDLLKKELEEQRLDAQSEKRQAARDLEMVDRTHRERLAKIKQCVLSVNSFPESCFR